MSRDIDSGALTDLNRSLGVAGPGSGRTELEDGSLVQTIEVKSTVRRSRSLGTTTGWFYGVLRHVHAGAGGLSATMDPYAVPVANAIPPYPAPTVPEGQDVYLISASCVRNSGTATNFLSGAVVLLPPAVNQAFGANDAAAAVSTQPEIALCRWDLMNTEITSTPNFALQQSGEPRPIINLRIPRGSILSFESEVDTGAFSCDCVLIFSLGTAAFGQDVGL